MIRLRKYLLSTLILLLTTTLPARANFTITIGNANLNPGAGQTATLTVLIANMPGTPILPLDGYNFELRITQTENTQTQLGFTTNQPQPYGDANYVFFNNSLNGVPPATTLGKVSTRTTPNDTYIGGDATNDGTTKTLSGTFELFQFQVAGLSGAMPRVGDTFQVSLVASSNTSFTNGSSTDPYVVTAAGGMINVVPEPSSTLLIGLGLAATSLVLAWRRRSAAATCRIRV